LYLKALSALFSISENLDHLGEKKKLSDTFFQKVVIDKSKRPTHRKIGLTSLQNQKSPSLFGEGL
jgi:hypothetical protein